MATMDPDPKLHHGRPARNFLDVAAGATMSA